MALWKLRHIRSNAANKPPSPGCSTTSRVNRTCLRKYLILWKAKHKELRKLTRCQQSFIAERQGVNRTALHKSREFYHCPASCTQKESWICSFILQALKTLPGTTPLILSLKLMIRFKESTSRQYAHEAGTGPAQRSGECVQNVWNREWVMIF